MEEKSFINLQVAHHNKKDLIETLQQLQKKYGELIRM